MKFSEIKQKAKQDIKGNKGTFFAMTLVLGFIMNAVIWPAFVLLSIIFVIMGQGIAAQVMLLIGMFVLLYAITSPFTMSMSNIDLKFSRSEKLKVSDLFFGFKMYLKSVDMYFLKSVYLMFWTLLFYIPGIIKSYSYAMSDYILLENPNLTTDEAITRSRKMMDGNKFKFLLFQLSFIGWYLVIYLTCGIASIYVLPYIKAATGNFYLALKKEQGLENDVTIYDNTIEDDSNQSDVSINDEIQETVITDDPAIKLK